MKQLRQLWRQLWTSLWFVPALLVLTAVLLAVVLIDIDSRIDSGVWAAWPRLFGAGAAGSRGMLEVIATSMITVAGVVFSITIAALAQASNQYSSRLLRNFMGDRTNQVVLGVFVSIFIYCLVVLRTIRGGDEGAFVPSLAVLAGFGMAFVGISFLIYFIHHTATSIQASEIIARVAKETIGAIDHLFPQRLGEEKDQSPQIEAMEETPHEGQIVRSLRTGYIQAVDSELLLAFARQRRVVVRMQRGIGDFAAEGAPLVVLVQRQADGSPVDKGTEEDATVDDATVKQLNRAYTIGRQRTIEQDAAFGIRQIVDVANKALSPGINDTTTAVLCVDYLAALLLRIAQRHIESPYRFEGAELRVIARTAAFPEFLSNAFDEIRRNGEGNVTILTTLLRALATLAPVTQTRDRQQALLQQVEALHEVVRRSIDAPQERQELAAECLRLISLVQRDGDQPGPRGEN